LGEVKDPHTIVIRPYITEKSVALSYGDPLATDEKELVRKYTFVVDMKANKIEIKGAIEAIYNAGKKAADAVKVTSVRTMRVPGKKKRIRGKWNGGYTPDRKKAIVTLAKGQMLEDYGV
jgi:large subunit ribosomal protein L23